MTTRLMAAFAASLFLIAGCNGSSSSPPELANVRVVHASPDAPNVNALVNGNAVFQDLAYGEATRFVTVEAGSVDVTVDGRLPGDQLATVIGPASLDFEGGVQYTVLAIGAVADIAPLVISQERSSVPSNSVRARVVHAAPQVQEVAVYVTAPGADLAGEAPLGTFSFGEDLGPVEVAAGDYQIRVAVPGVTPAVVFDSGTVTLAGGANLFIAAIQNTGPGAAPVSLLVADGGGSFQILDQATPSNIRVVHASPDAPAVDVFVNDDFANPFLSNVPFPAASPYIGVPGGDYNIKVTPAGNIGFIAIDADLTLPAGAETTVIAVDELANIGALVLQDDGRRVATEARVRIVHGAPNAGPVDIYVTAVGAGIAGASPAVGGFEFLDETGYLGLAPGSYDVSVALAGSDVVAIGPVTVDITGGGVYTAIARDPLPGGQEFGLILLDDFIAN